MNAAREASLEKALLEIASHDLVGLRDPYRLILQRIIDAAKHALAKEAKPVEPYPNEALDDIAKQLLDDWNLSPQQWQAYRAAFFQSQFLSPPHPFS